MFSGVGAGRNVAGAEVVLRLLKTAEPRPAEDILSSDSARSGPNDLGSHQMPDTASNGVQEQHGVIRATAAPDVYDSSSPWQQISAASTLQTCVENLTADEEIDAQVSSSGSITSSDSSQSQAGHAEHAEQSVRELHSESSQQVRQEAVNLLLSSLQTHQALKC